MTLERLWLQAWLDGLQRIACQPAVRPVERPVVVPAPRVPRA